MEVAVNRRLGAMVVAPLVNSKATFSVRYGPEKNQ